MLNMKAIIKFLLAVPTIFTSHSLANLVRRTDGPTAPPCSVPFTPYLYAGCYSDTRSPRALAFSPVGQNRQEMTIEKCAAVCKGKSLGNSFVGERILTNIRKQLSICRPGVLRRMLLRQFYPRHPGSGQRMHLPMHRKQDPNLWWE